MTDNTPIANPATNQRAWKPRLGRGWRTLLPYPNDGDRWRRNHWQAAPLPRHSLVRVHLLLPIPKWMPPAEVLVKAIHFPWFQIIISFYVHLFLCYGDGR